jgi:23S rRNA (guanine745-N1)-methyltransferase
MSGLVETLRSWLPVSTNNTPPRTIELGCGEGTLSAALFADEPTGFCGIDLSKRAIKLAARHWPQATWVLANADRFLPAGDHSVDRVVSLFGRRPINEIDRVLDVEGQCIVALPGAEDLIELREAVQQSGRRRSRWQAVVDEMKTIGMDCVEHQLWQHRVQLAGDEIADALAMTYRAVRRSQQQRLDSLEQMTVTLAADLMRFSRVDDQSNSPRA